MLLTSACASTRGLQVESAGSIGCAPSAIEVSQVRGGVNGRSWLAQCDDVSFQCSSASEGCVNCAPVRPRGSAGRTTTGEPAAGHGDDDDAQLRRQGPRFEFSRDGQTLRGVRATFRTEAATLVFTFAPAQAPDVVQVGVIAREGSTLSGCTELALTGGAGRPPLTAPLTELQTQLPRAALVERTQAQPAPTVQFCGREWPLQRADVHGFERFGEHMDEALAATDGGASAEAATSSVPPTAPAALDPDVADAVRAHLDEPAALLRGCAAVGSTAVLPVEATWDATGALLVRVSGRDDQAVHDCATSVLRERRAPAGAPGRLIHVLAPN